MAGAALICATTAHIAATHADNRAAPAAAVCAAAATRTTALAASRRAEIAVKATALSVLQIGSVQAASKARMMKMRNRNLYPRRRQTNPLPRLRFTPYAWAKLVFLRDLGPTEVGGFGISSLDDLLLVEDVRLVKQICGPATVSFDDSAVADFFDEQVDRGTAPERFARIWIHTHPGSSSQPSLTDERTFKRSFSGPDWALMCILARSGRSYARLAFRTGPGGELTLRVRVDYQLPFAASDHVGWTEEYERCVTAIDRPLVCDRPRNEDHGHLEHLFRGLGGAWSQE